MPMQTPKVTQDDLWDMPNPGDMGDDLTTYTLGELPGAAGRERGGPSSATSGHAPVPPDPAVPSGCGLGGSRGFKSWFQGVEEAGPSDCEVFESADFNFHQNAGDSTDDDAVVDMENADPGSGGDSAHGAVSPPNHLEAATGDDDSPAGHDATDDTAAVYMENQDPSPGGDPAPGAVNPPNDLEAGTGEDDSPAGQDTTDDTAAVAAQERGWWCWCCSSDRKPHRGPQH